MMAAESHTTDFKHDERHTDHTKDKTSELQRERNVRFNDALRRTSSLLGEEDGSKDWISETRSNFRQCGSAVLPRQRPAMLVTELDRSRRHNPQPRLASIFRARYGQRDVCTVETLLPEEKGADVRDKTAYEIEFRERAMPLPVRVKSAPITAHGILPNCRIPYYDDVREEILLPVEISEKSPSTQDPNKYMTRKRRVSETLNQHRTRETPYGKNSLQSAPPAGRSSRHFVTNQGRPLAHRRHVSAPPSSLSVRGFDGGARRLKDNTMHAQLLPFLRGPRII